MASFVLITMVRPFSVFDEHGRIISTNQRRLVIPFDDDGAHRAASMIVVQAMDGLPPGFAHVATHIVPGEVVSDDLDQQH